MRKMYSGELSGIVATTYGRIWLPWRCLSAGCDAMVVINRAMGGEDDMVLD